MFWDKKKYIINIRGGKGSINTEKMRGMTQQLIIRPETDDIVWSLKMTDLEDDEVFEIKDHCGRLDDKSGLPIGKDASEKLTLIFSNVSENRPIKVIFKVREIE